MSEPLHRHPGAGQGVAELERLARTADALLEDLSTPDVPPAASLVVARLRRQLAAARELVGTAAATLRAAESDLVAARAEGERLTAAGRADAARLADAAAREHATRREATDEWVVRTRRAAEQQAGALVAAAEARATSLVEGATAEAERIQALTDARNELDHLRRALTELLAGSTPAPPPPAAGTPLAGTPATRGGRLRRLFGRRRRR